MEDYFDRYFDSVETDDREGRIYSEDVCETSLDEEFDEYV